MQERNKVKTLLVTGFEPFGAQSVNPSWECLCDLPEMIEGVRVVKARLPVEWDGINQTLEALLNRERPDAVLSFGQAGGCDAIRIERIAMNLRDSQSPDNAGKTLVNAPVVEGGPDGLFATLPVYDMRDALRSVEIPAAFSYTPGPYLCNNAMYYPLLFAKQKRPGMLSGFVHVPFMEGQSDTAYVMSLATIARAALILCKTVCRAL